MRLLCSMSTGHQHSVKLLIRKLFKKIWPGCLGKSTLPCNAGNSKRLYWMRYLRNKMSLRLTNPWNVKEMCRWYGIIYEIKKRCWKFNISFSCRRPESNFTSVYKTKEIRGFLQPFQPSTNILQTIRKIIFQLLLRKFGNTKGGFITMNRYQGQFQSHTMKWQKQSYNMFWQPLFITIIWFLHLLKQIVAKMNKSILSPRESLLSKKNQLRNRYNRIIKNSV